MTDLSPAAQAVLIAEAKSRCLRDERGCHPNDSDWNGCWVCVHRRGLAAALRAAADQVAPSDAMEPRNYLPVAIECQRIRSELLAIAAELEGATIRSENDFDDT
jgi:hypothetical protein